MRNLLILVLLVSGTLILAATSFADARSDNTSANAEACGKASWYALTSKTASGETMNPAKMTAAHRDYRFGTKLKVTNTRNGRSVVVRINDRGPFIRDRILDLSKAAAAQIGMVSSGHAPVCYERLS